MTIEPPSLLQTSRDHDIDPQNGFLPAREPLQRLNGVYEKEWESKLDQAIQLPLHFAGGGLSTSEQDEANARQWRRSIRNMPVLTLSTDILDDIAFARRARVVLSFLAHFYIHSQPNPTTNLLSPSKLADHDALLAAEESRGKNKTSIPASIARPWQIVSKYLDLPPILTYADTVLWNWHLTDPTLGIRADNLSMTTTFTGTETEEHFFKTSLLIELQGAEALRLIRSALSALDDGEQLTHHFKAITAVIKDMVLIFLDITNGCDPSTFYWQVRPWFNGSDTSPTTFTEHGTVLQEAGKGWTYESEGVDAGGLKVLTGPSAGQSSVIHSLDVFLGVDHKPHHGKSSSPAPVTGSAPPAVSFMQRMQRFMPGLHRRFLSQLDDFLHNHPSLPLLTDHVDKTEGKRAHLIQRLVATFCSSNCLAAYNEAITTLCSLRDQHMRIVSIYILIPARQSPPHHQAPLSDNIRIKKDGTTKGERGTGGTELVTFLRGTRECTRQARLCSSVINT